MTSVLLGALSCNQTTTATTKIAVRRKIAPDGQIARQPLRTRGAADKLIERDDCKRVEEEKNHCQRSVPARCHGKSCSFDAWCEVAQDPILLLSRHIPNTSSCGRSTRSHIGNCWPHFVSSLFLSCYQEIISTASGEDLCGSVPARHQIHQHIDYARSRRVQEMDKFKYGGDDGVNLCAPQ